jgi:NAD(P)H-flavin reductase
VGIAPLAMLQDVLEGAGGAGAGAGGHGAGGDPPPPRRRRQRARAITVLLGFRDRSRAQGAGLLRGAQVTTDDGSVGPGCLVTELLEWELDHDDAAAVYACGPAGMLEAVRALCAQRNVPAQLALEAPMACGFGACYGCVVPTHDGSYLRVCVDGPVIDAAELDSVEAHAGAPA